MRIVEKVLVAGAAIGTVAACGILGLDDEHPICDATFYTAGAPPEAGQVATRLGLEGYQLGRKENKSWVGPDASLPDGFTHVGENWGGLGRTLQVLGCDDGVYLQFSGERLRTVAVRSGWKGTTDGGMRIGDTFEKFKRTTNAADVPLNMGVGQERVYESRFSYWWFVDGRLRGIEVSVLPTSRVGPNSEEHAWP